MAVGRNSLTRAAKAAQNNAPESGTDKKPEDKYAEDRKVEEAPHLRGPEDLLPEMMQQPVRRLLQLLHLLHGETRIPWASGGFVQQEKQLFLYSTKK